jgi:hypothetical protein
VALLSRYIGKFIVFAVLNGENTISVNVSEFYLFKLDRFKL